MRHSTIATLVLLGTGSALPALALASPHGAALIPHGGWTYPRAAPPTPTTARTTLAAPIDPMAPRPDAPVFRLGRSTEYHPTRDTADEQAAQPATAPSQAATAVSPNGARYYSVHRQAGRQPDAPVLPEPVYLDALPVDLSTPVTSEDLAAPPSVPVMTRDSRGRLRPTADIEDPA